MITGIFTIISVCTKPKFLMCQLLEVEGVDTGHQGAGFKTKIVKHRFHNQDTAGTTPEDENGIEGPGGAAAAPAEAAPPTGEEEPPACGWGWGWGCGCGPQPIRKGSVKGQEGW